VLTFCGLMDHQVYGDLQNCDCSNVQCPDVTRCIGSSYVVPYDLCGCCKGCLVNHGEECGDPHYTKCKTGLVCKPTTTVWPYFIDNYYRDMPSGTCVKNSRHRCERTNLEGWRAFISVGKKGISSKKMGDHCVECECPSNGAVAQCRQATCRYRQALADRSPPLPKTSKRTWRMLLNAFNGQ